MPTAQSTTPGMSNLWLWVSRSGTSRQARMKPTMPTGHVDEEDPLPAEAVDEEAAEDRADQHRDRRRRAPQAHRAAAVVRREGAGDHRHRLRGQQRGAEALDGARGDQHLDRAGEPAPRGGEGEDDQADQVDPLGPEPVTEASGDQQRHGVGQQVGAGHPDDGVDVGVEALHDPRVGHRDDRGVDEDHEEPDDQRPEGRPGLVGRGHAAGNLPGRRIHSVGRVLAAAQQLLQQP